MALKKPLTLSVIVPAFNEELHLKDCLDSLVSQTEKPDQVVVVDNNSTDKTAEIARQYPFVTVIGEPKQGIAHAHHAGFKKAAGQLIARIDADSVLPTSWVADIKKFYATSDDNTALTGSGIFKNVRAPGLHRHLVDTQFIVSRLLLGYSSLWGPNMVIPRKAWDKVSARTCPEKSTTYDDFDIALHLHEAGVKTVWKPGIRVSARMRYIGEPVKLWRYILRWPGTLRNHGDKRWVVAYAGCVLMMITQYPLLRALKK